ncbi:hypothetical protein B0H13DRAFT_1879005 [Mycena leptocephala]|nr:hypothetical protein B0H13DRAFT_1879005 [Mycena leptocephala]
MDQDGKKRQRGGVDRRAAAGSIDSFHLPSIVLYLVLCLESIPPSILAPPYLAPTLHSGLSNPRIATCSELESEAALSIWDKRSPERLYIYKGIVSIQNWGHTKRVRTISDAQAERKSDVQSKEQNVEIMIKGTVIPEAVPLSVPID